MMTVNSDLEFSWKYKDYELKACPKLLVRFHENEKNETINLVKWSESREDKRFCWSLASFIRGKEGYV